MMEPVQIENDAGYQIFLRVLTGAEQTVQSAAQLHYKQIR